MKKNKILLNVFVFTVVFVLMAFSVSAAAYTSTDFTAFDGVNTGTNSYTVSSDITATYKNGTGTVGDPVNLKLTGYAPIVTPWFESSWTTYNYVTIGIKLPAGFTGTSVYDAGVMRYDRNPGTYEMGTGSTDLATTGAAAGYLDYSFAANSNNTKKDGLVKLQVIWNANSTPEYFTIDINGLQLGPDAILPTATVVQSGQTITYTFSEPVQLTNNDGSAITGTIASKLAFYQVTGLDYTTASLVPGIVITDASLVGNVLTITYTGTLVGQTNTKYIVDAWGYKVADLAGNKMLPSESAMFTVTSVITPAIAPILGTAGHFVVLAKTAVTTTGATKIVGDVGLSPAAASFITGFGLVLAGDHATSSLVTGGNVYASNYAVPTPDDMTKAINDMVAAYTAAAAAQPNTVVGLNAGNIGGLTLTPGVYKWSTGLTIPLDVTLDCKNDSNGVFIFQIAQDLVISSAKKVILTNGCQAGNVFWQVAGPTGATLGTYSTFSGTILSAKQVILKTGATLNGRALAQTQVILDSSNIGLTVVALTTCNLMNPAFVTGIVYDQSNNTIAGAAVTVDCAGNGTTQTGYGTTNSNGNYLICFDANLCQYGDNLYAVADTGTASGSNTGEMCDSEECFVPIGVVNINTTIPELGVVAGGLALVGALGIFLYRRK